MAWSGLTLCTDSDLGTLEPASTNGQWGAFTWANQRAEAKRDIKIWLQNDYQSRLPGVAVVADRILDTYGAEKVWGYTASTYADKTTEATESTENDVNLAAIFATVGTDRVYLASLSSFDGIDVRMLANLNAIASVLTVKYSGPSGWTSLTHTDGTALSGKTFAQTGRITWTQPGDWQRRTLNNSADAYYWIELSVSVALTAGTSAGQLLVIQAQEGLKRVCALQALGYIAKNLAAQAPSTDYWLHKARNQFKTGYMDEADKLYAEMRDKGGIPIDLNLDGVIEEEETQVTSPIRLGRG
jgi:hypothetical protein